jgi:hypothetical protein
VFLACLVIYHANGRPRPEIDCVAAPYTAWALLRTGSIDLRPYPDVAYLEPWAIRALPDGRVVSIRPVGSALAVVPFVAPFAVFSEQPPNAMNMLHLGKLSSATAVAGAAALFYLLCLRLAPAAAWPATVLLALGTTCWSVASQSSWQHGPGLFCVMLALFFLARAEGELRFWAAVAAGLALGLATLTRPTLAFFGLATGLALVADLGRRWRALLGLAAGAGGPLALLVLSNWLMFGDLVGGYDGACRAERAPWWLALSGLLIAPSRGLVCYTPALLLAPLGLVALRRAPWLVGWRRALLLTWAGAAAGTFVFFARWHDWWGGWCFGPRALTEALPVGCLFFALAWVGLRRPWQRGLAAGLVGLSVLVHFVGVAGYRAHVGWNERHDRLDHGLCLFELHDTQIEAHARATLRKVVGAAEQATSTAR